MSGTIYVGVQRGLGDRSYLWNPLAALQATFLGYSHTGIGHTVQCRTGCIYCAAARRNGATLCNTVHVVWFDVVEGEGVRMRVDYFPTGPSWQVYRIQATGGTVSQLARCAYDSVGKPYNDAAWRNALPAMEYLGWSRGIGAPANKVSVTAADVLAAPSFFCSEFVMVLLLLSSSYAEDYKDAPLPRNCWPHTIAALMADMARDSAINSRNDRSRDPDVLLLPTINGRLTRASMRSAPTLLSDAFYNP